MIKIHSTRHVLAVRNLARTTAHFVDVLGFDKDSIDAEGWSFLSRGGFELMIGECPEDMTALETNNHSYFALVLIQGIDQLHQEYLERGADIILGVADKPWGLREFCVRTPDGHRIVFAQETRLD